MVINVCVQYNGGRLPDVILLTRCGYTWEPFWYHEEFMSLQPMFPPKSFDNFPPEAGCSEGLDAFRFFFSVTLEKDCTASARRIQVRATCD